MSFFAKIKIFLQKNIKTILLIVVLIIAFAIRINNIFRYNTWWADDGGAHVGYVNYILKHHCLPSMSENYLAWHEPLYYIFQAGWTKLGLIIGFSLDNVINWQEFFGLILFGGFIFLIYKLTLLLTRNDWIALLNIFVFSILFSSVKLSAYVNNEFLVQILIILLVFLFLKFSLLSQGKDKIVFWWSVILGLALLVKLTAVLVLFSVILLWLFYCIKEKKKYVLKYLVLCLVVVSFINLPWLIYKKTNFGSALVINIYEQENKQNILSSDAWEYIFKSDSSIFIDQPLWVYGKYSFFPILLADTFTDYYNLFNHVDDIKNLPEDSKIMIDNGQFSTPSLRSSALWSVRLGLIIALVWLIGIVGFIAQMIKHKKFDYQKIFLFILIFGGIIALIYNNLRFPYLERGVLKASFIFFVFPLFAIVSYNWWWKILRSRKWLLFTVLFLPVIIYAVVAWPILFV